MNDTIIKHHTKSLHIASIFNDKFIALEGHNVENQFKDEKFKNDHPLHWHEVSKVWKMVKWQYKLIGRYVWFTEEDHANCCNSQIPCPTHSFSFYAGDIGARRWPVVRNALLRTKGSKVIKFIYFLEKSAIEAGDNPDLWWVSKRAISLDYWLYDNDPWFDPAWIVAANDDVDGDEQLAA